jgi:autotransporter-associated beta strand protein
MTGPGTATVSGSNTYEGDTTVTGGTLHVPTAAALPAGTAIVVGASGTLVFGPSLQLSPVVSGNGAAVGLAAATNGAVSPASTVSADVPAVAPLQARALVSDSTAVAAVLPAALPPAPSAPSRAAADSVWKSYDRSTGPKVVHVPRAAGYLAWWNSTAASNSGDSTETDRRLAALDAVLAQYGSP